MTVQTQVKMRGEDGAIEYGVGFSPQAAEKLLGLIGVDMQWAGLRDKLNWVLKTAAEDAARKGTDDPNQTPVVSP